MRRWLILGAVVAIAVGAGTAGYVALADDDGGGEAAPINPSEDVAADDCSLVHNVDGCGAPAQDPVASDCQLPESVEPCDDGGTSPGQKQPIRSDEGIDPDECNTVHNIDACSPEELEKAGIGVPEGEQPAAAPDDAVPPECAQAADVELCEDMAARETPAGTTAD
jgi:hypothetical protein